MIAQSRLPSLLVLYALREGRDFYEKGSIRDYLVLNSIGNCVVKSVTHRGKNNSKLLHKQAYFYGKKCLQKNGLTIEGLGRSSKRH